jgi:hypothetical protein
MRRPLALALVVAAGLAAASCSTSPCQDLGQRLCGCTGLTSDTCKTQVEEQLKRLDPPQATLDHCQQVLDTCNAPSGASFCEWLKTSDGMAACGLVPPEFAGTTL